MDNYAALFGKKLAGGGTPAPVLIEKSITANGDYSASADNADGYSSVSVDVPNTYAAGDEGKVVQSGALVAQGSDTVTQNGTVDTTLINSLTVNVPTGGGQSANDVNFRDYDGTIVASYSAAEFANLNAMPENPTHDGLTAQGWNWTLQDAKTYVASYGKLNIGQMYVTSDGKTRIYIELTEGRTSPILKLHLNEDSEVDIDWGDGTTHDTLSGSGDKTTNSHNYFAGSYVIAISVVSGSIAIPTYMLSNGNSSSSSPDRCYLNAIKKIEIGRNLTSIEQAACQSLTSLSSITIPNSVTSIGASSFNGCYSLFSVTVPNSVTILNNNVFSSCQSLTSITIPESITSIDESALNGCTSLSSITIPSSVTNIGYAAFAACYSIMYITLAVGLISIGDYAFNTCVSLSSITIPSSVTNIGKMTFNKCYSLYSITINKTQGSISGSPWGATTGSPTSTQIVWTG